MQHKTDTYHDSYKRIAFCTVCGKEGSELIGTECVGDIEKKVDKEQSKD